MKYVCGRERLRGRQRETDTERKGTKLVVEGTRGVFGDYGGRLLLACLWRHSGRSRGMCLLCVCVYKHTVALTLFCHTLVNQSLIKYPFRGAGLGEVPLVVGMQDRACVCALETGHRCEEVALFKI